LFCRTTDTETRGQFLCGRPTGMYGLPLCGKRKMKVTGWSAQMYPAFVEHKLLALDGMRCALVLLS